MMVWSPAPEEADAMVRKPDNDDLPDEIPMDLSGPAADNDGPTGDLSYLSMPWAKASYDGGLLALVDGVWIVLKSGDGNDAAVVREALRKVPIRP